DCTDLTVAFVSRAAAVARQISDVPAWVLLRLTRVQVRPAPLTAAVWALVAGPSEEAKARSSSFGPAVLKAAVVTGPRPCLKIGAPSMAMPAETLLTVTEMPAAEALRPAASYALALRVC